MKKNYQKPTIESVILKNEYILASSPGCNPQDTIPSCNTETCSGSDVA